VGVSVRCCINTLAWDLGIPGASRVCMPAISRLRDLAWASASLGSAAGLVGPSLDAKPRDGFVVMRRTVRRVRI